MDIAIAGGVILLAVFFFAVVLRVEPRELLVNQQLTAEVDYYTAYRLPHAPGQEAPRAEGFVAEALPEPDAEYVTVNGRQYVRATRRWALFPASPMGRGLTRAEASTSRMSEMGCTFTLSKTPAGISSRSFSFSVGSSTRGMPAR